VCLWITRHAAWSDAAWSDAAWADADECDPTVVRSPMTDAEVDQAESDLGIVDPSCDPTQGACTAPLLPSRLSTRLDSRHAEAPATAPSSSKGLENGTKNASSL
jgi:hypothetical protein